MRQTVLGVFDHCVDARASQRTLGEAGVAHADIVIYSISMDARVEKGPRVYAPGNGDARHHNRVFDQLEQLFARIFKHGEYPPETEDYREFARRGGTIVSADVSEMQVELVLELMRRAGAADIEERAQAWRDGRVDAGILEQALHRGSSTAHGHSSGQHEPSTAQQGNRMTQGGRVAGTARSSDIREHAAVPRDPSRAYSRDESAAGGTSIQGAAFSSAEPKIPAGMQQVTTRTGEIGSTPSMENQRGLPRVSDVGLTRTPESADAGVKSRSEYLSDNGIGRVNAERTSGTGLVGDPVMGTRLDEDLYDNEFREDYDANYASTGASYDEYRRAYAHGSTLAQDERYRGHDWQRVESDARENWESRYPESGWERFKAAVRHGWDRVTGG